VLGLVGQIPRRMIGKGFGALHEIPDQFSIMQGLTKWSGQIGEAAAAPAVMDEAFRQLRSGRPRPVCVEVPADVWAEEAEDPGARFIEGEAAPVPSAQEIAEAADLLAAATHPMIVVGGGAQHAGAEVRQLAELLQAPVICFRNGQGVLDRRHPLAQTLPFGNRYWPQVDCVLGIGTRLAAPLLGWGTDDALRHVRIEIDPEEMSRVATPDVALLGDAAATAQALAEAVAARHAPRADLTGELAGMEAQLDAEFARLTPQVDYLRAIRAALGEEGIFVDELTQVGYVSRFAYPTYRPRSFISTGSMGTLGWGFAAGLGVKAVRPDVPVVSIAGDGGFLFTAGELATAVHHRINLVCVVFADNAYGNVRRMQQEQFGDHLIATDLTNPDFVALAESHGALGLRAEGPEALERQLRKAIEAQRPAVIEVPLGEVPSPWDYVLPPRVRGLN
jgi:acetolactate synthase-1/2/3 large subunit